MLECTVKPMGSGYLLDFRSPDWPGDKIYVGKIIFEQHSALFTKDEQPEKPKPRRKNSNDAFEDIKKLIRDSGVKKVHNRNSF